MLPRQELCGTRWFTTENFLLTGNDCHAACNGLIRHLQCNTFIVGAKGKPPVSPLGASVSPVNQSLIHPSNRFGRLQHFSAGHQHTSFWQHRPIRPAGCAKHCRTRRDVKHCRIADFRPAGVRSTAALQGSMHFLPHRQSTQTQVGVAQCKLTHSITNITQPTVTVRIRDPDGFPGTQYHPPRSSRVDQRRWGSV